MKKTSLLLLFVLSITTSCASPQQTVSTGTYQDDFKALEQVEVTDGINKSEAFVIAKAYFWSKISGCGYPKQPISENGRWVSETLVGIAGMPGELIFVDKESGEVFSENGNKTVSLEELKGMYPK